MASGLAHELNQPLCAIQTYANVCLRTSENGITDVDKLKDNLKVITSQSKRAGEIINGIKAFVQKRAPHHTTTDINEIVETTVSFLDSLIQKNDVKIDFQLGTKLPFVLADPIQIEQVLINLITNAIESMQNIQTRQHRLTLRTSLDSTNKIEVAVHDTGEGFLEITDKLVEPFFTTKKGSLGIGLSVSRSIIESHGGTLNAEKNPDNGSTFKFTLPVQDRGKK
jgi:C4-dicarboxylate-specific signal transduction histidine kinase